jgi:RNA polymerase sigma-70 factor (ECF subfamily)
MAMRVAASITGSRADADDAVQEAFIRVMSRPDRWSGRGNVRAWIPAVVANAARTRMRTEAAQSARRHRAEDVKIRTVPRDDPPADQERIWRAVAELPDVYAEVIALHFQAGLEPAEIATAKRCPRFTVHTRLRRGLSRLRSKLGGTGAMGALLALRPGHAGGCESSANMWEGIRARGPSRPEPIRWWSTMLSSGPRWLFFLLLGGAVMVSAVIGVLPPEFVPPLAASAPLTPDPASEDLPPSRPVLEQHDHEAAVMALLPMDSQWVLEVDPPAGSRLFDRFADIGVDLHGVTKIVVAGTADGFAAVIDGDDIGALGRLGERIAQLSHPGGGGTGASGLAAHFGAIEVRTVSRDRLLVATAAEMVGLTARSTSGDQPRKDGIIARRLQRLPSRALIRWTSVPWVTGKNVTLWWSATSDGSLSYEGRIRTESMPAAEALQSAITAYLDERLASRSAQVKPFLVALRPSMFIHDNVLVLTGGLTAEEIDEAWRAVLAAVQ